ncbi:MAG: SDR family NAD(P)-dependent oxidoreductase [Planctomycetota bacterium]
MRFKDRVVIVSGASRGIGRAVAIGFGSEGARVVVNHPGEEQQAREVVAAIEARGGAALAIRADVAAKRETDALVRATLDRFGHIDVLINNAGICPFAEFLQIDEALWDRVTGVNLRGVFFLTQAVARVMVERKAGGRIVTVSSISALVGGALQTHYTPTKAAVRSLMQSLAIVLGPHGITCNSVLPGTILTDINRAHFAEHPDERAHFERRIPVGRLGAPEDLVGAILFLASGEAAYVNGAELLVDGGLFVNLQ